MQDKRKQLINALDNQFNRGSIVKIGDVYHTEEHEEVLKFRREVAEKSKKDFQWEIDMSNKASKNGALALEIFASRNSSNNLLMETITKQSQRELLMFALKRNLSDKMYEYILNQIEEEIFNKLSLLTEFNFKKEDIHDTFSVGFLNYIAMNHRDAVKPEFFKYLSDDTTAQFLIESGELNEKELSYLAGNTKLSDYVRELAFAEGCDVSLVDNFTKSTAQNAFEAVYDLLIETDERDVENKTFINDANKTLVHLIQSGHLTHNQEKELMTAARNIDNMFVTKKIMRETRNQDTIADIIVEATKGDRKFNNLVYSNLVDNNMISEENAVTLGHLMTPPTYNDEVLKNHLAEKGTSHLCKIMRIATMNDSWYRPFMRVLSTQPMMTIATSEKTPSSVLKEMYDDKNITEDIKRYALLNYHLRTKGLEDVFSAIHNTSRTPFQHSLAHLLHSESELKNLLSALDETEKQLSNKLYINEVVTLKDSIAKEYNMYSTMRQYPTIFEVHDNENDAPSMRNFSVLVGEKDETLIREAFNKFDVESIIIIQEFMLKPLQNYMFGENKDNEFYTKFDDVATMYQISEDVLKEKQHGLIDKEGIKLLGEIERMSRSEMERFVEEFEYDAATSIFEPTKEEQAKYEYITSHFLSDYDER